MKSVDRPLRVFLCHSSNDKPAVRELYQKLRAEPWIQPWLDEEELYPGQDWNMEIEKAVETADAIVVCLSKGSITKEGYIQREIRIALDYADYKPEGTLFIIPVRLEECTPPKRLARWQYADYFEGQHKRAFERLLISLKKRSDSISLKGEETLPAPKQNSEPEIKNEKPHVIPESVKPISSFKPKSIDRATYEKVLEQARKQVKALPKIVVYCLYKYFCDDFDVVFDPLDDRDKIRSANKAVEDYYLEVVDGRYSVNLYDPTILKVNDSVSNLHKCLDLIEDDEISNLYETLLSEYGFEPFISNKRYWENCLYEKSII